LQHLPGLLVDFLYAVQPGAADRACGIQVSRLAGLPSWVADRAEALLADATRETATERAVAEDRAKGAATRRRSTATPGSDPD
jgi:DNA mismatch repair protein MutS